LYWTLYNPALWLLGITLGLLNACRYGYFDWGLKHLTEVREMPVGKAALEYGVIALGATAGSYLTGWATDRFFGSRRAPVVCILLILLGCLTPIYETVAQDGSIATLLMLLIVIGFCVMGPQVLLVGTAPADLALRGTSAAAAGFVNFMGYVGASVGAIVTGYYSAAENGGWHLTFQIWAAWAFAGAAIMAILWNTTAQRVRVLPGFVPKLGAIALLVAAGTALGVGDQPRWLYIVTAAASICLMLSFVNRWAAIPALAVSAVGLITVFIIYVRGTDSVAGHESAAMVFYGLTMIAALMILVERKGEPCESS
jgi:MFS family permease